MSETIYPKEVIEQVEAKRKREAAEAERIKLSQIMQRVFKDAKKQKQLFPDLTDETIFAYHSNLLVCIANEICLAGQNRKFEIDDRNRDVLRFLLYYFNDCPLAENVFPKERHKLHKNILIMGGVGTGKTLMMQIFSEYLRYTNNPNFFHNLSVTQMVNYYTIHSNLDRYTFNEEGSTGFQSKPMNVCLNDIGVGGKLFYGMDTKILTNEFLHARNEIWTQSAPDRRKFAHLTTNLKIEDLKKEFADNFGRLVDRFKTYNILTLTGESRR